MGFEFRCKDADGIEHVYSGDFHRGSDGMRIVKQLAALVVEPIVSALGPLAAAAVTTKGAKGIGSLNASILADIDAGAVGQAIRAALTSAPDSLEASILRFTNRDGKPLVEQGKVTVTFEESYARNYLELGRALWEVCSANRFFPGLDFFESVKKRALAGTVETPTN